jgi:hypothetical protein
VITSSAELSEFPGADVKPADGSQFVDLLVPRLSKAPVESWRSSKQETTYDNTSSLLCKSDVVV